MAPSSGAAPPAAVNPATHTSTEKEEVSATRGAEMDALDEKVKATEVFWRRLLFPPGRALLDQILSSCTPEQLSAFSDCLQTYSPTSGLQKSAVNKLAKQLQSGTFSAPSNNHSAQPSRHRYVPRAQPPQKMEYVFF
jgi:hypothetical protein